MTDRHARTPHMLLAATLALGLAGPALAQEGDDSGSGSGGDAAAQVSDAQLEKFAAAYGQVRSVRAEYAQKMRQDMVAAIKDAGLDLEQYKQISQQLKGSKELQQRLQQIAQQSGQMGQSGSQGGSGQQQ